MLAGILPVLKAQGVYLAAQCCEHLNRAIVIEQEAAEKYGYEQVNAVPQPHAGGSWATNCWQAFEHPVLVEEVCAAAGIDIGGTLIGMHLKRVAVPVRLTIKQIGAAPIICARTRPKCGGFHAAVLANMPANDLAGRAADHKNIPGAQVCSRQQFFRCLACLRRNGGAIRFLNGVLFHNLPTFFIY